MKYIKYSCSAIRENTIASMTNAQKHGADMIEFDVQLSKDMIPVIYHDFYVCTAMMKKGKELGQVPHDLLHLPVKELTLAQVYNSFTFLYIWLNLNLLFSF